MTYYLKHLLITQPRFDAIMYSTSTNEILMRAILNVHAGRRFPTLAIEQGWAIIFVRGPL